MKTEVNGRILISTGTPWEDIIGYSRAVCVGNTIAVTGTAAMDGNKVVAPGSAAEQTRFILEKIRKALLETGADLKDVIRTRIYVTDMSKWEEIGKVHGEFFRDIRPATTMVEVKSLIRPEFLVEIEADAIVDVN